MLRGKAAKGVMEIQDEVHIIYNEINNISFVLAHF